jgi:hypothetical protein
MREILLRLACLSMVHPFAAASAQLPLGTITATVLDQSGRPVAGATVEMVAADFAMMASVVPDCLTDENGNCSTKVPFNKYHVAAKKEPDGYPDMTANLFGHGKWPADTEITPQNPSASVTITLGPKAASMIIHVVDDVTGSRISNARIALRGDGPYEFIATDIGRNSTVLIPPDHDVSVEISAQGYKPWVIETQPGTTHPNSLRLHSAESREVTVRLTPQ